MADFGKLNFSVSLKPTSAFPLDARCYFESLDDAVAAAKQAREVGSTETVYYYGQQVVVYDPSTKTATWYIISSAEGGSLSLLVGNSPDVDLSEYATISYVDAKIAGLEVGGVEVSDEMASGDMRPITSNAVYNVVGDIYTTLQNI